MIRPPGEFVGGQGKLAQRPEQSSLDYIECAPNEAPEIDTDVEAIACTHGGVFIVTTRMRVDACAHVQWSAYLTAEARIELHRQLIHSVRPFYCDTDSVYSANRLTRRVGDNLGEWGYEGGLKDWHSLAPKVYRYVDESGEEHVRGKGLSGLDGPGFAALAKGESWAVDSGVEGLRTAIRGQARDKLRGLFKRKSLSRMLHPIPGWIGGRELEPNGIDTRPTTIERYRAREE